MRESILAQHYRYLLREVTSIRDGDRGNSNPAMVQMVKNYEAVDIEAVADFIETTLRSTKQKVGTIKPSDIVDWSVTTEVVRELDREKK